MSAPLPIRFVRSAARSVVEAVDWWAANRPKAPDALITELERALQLVAHQPGIGARATNIELLAVRRIHLARIHYYLYYRVTSEPAIEVLALWHTSRGTRPNL